VKFVIIGFEPLQVSGIIAPGNSGRYADRVQDRPNNGREGVMSETFVSPIAIDLGAKHTGVFLAHYSSGSDPAEGKRAGHLITAPDGGKQWSQQGRTGRRHQRRGYKRAKLAKRLLHVILTDVYKIDLDRVMGSNQRAQQWLDGLLNNRGYTYLADEINKELLVQSGETIVHLTWKKDFPSNETLFSRLQRLSAELNVAARLHDEFPAPRDFFKRPAVQALLKESFPENEDVKRQRAIYTETRDALDRLVKAEQEGHRRRQEYLDNIRADIEAHPEIRALLKDTVLTPDSLANLLGHISNLQLRPLRRYFNDKSMSAGDRWVEGRMKKHFWNWIKSWRMEEANDKARRMTLLAREAEPLLKVWLETEPKFTIPPFEDQDNRRPPQCQSLLLDTKRLDAMLPNWKVITRKFLATNPGLDADLTHELEPKAWPMTKAMPKGHPWRGEDNYLARLLQRVLDRSKERDPYRLRLLASISDDAEPVSHAAQNARADLDRHLGGQHTGDFLRFAAAYYEEARNARDGSWDAEDKDNVLSRCALHPPRKSTQRERLVGAILGCELAETQATKLHDYLKAEKLGRSALIGIAHRAAAAQKEFGNALKEIQQRNRWQEQSGKKPENKEVWKLFADCELAAERIGGWLRQDRKGWSNYASPFSLAQLYNILETDINGFSSTCKGCSRENAWRSRTNADGIANAARLPADSVRPFDGVLRRLLDAQAHEIAQHKLAQVSEVKTPDTVHVPILIEENRFLFAEGIAEIKKSAKKKRDLLHKLGEEQQARWLDKEERIKKASKDICPYTGKPLGKDGQLDHIIPQSGTKKWQGTAYNSEANLIYVSTRGNTNKGKQIYELGDLDASYLKKQFGTSDIAAITTQIDNALRDYFEGRKSYTSFIDLSPEEQLCLRHALFAPNPRERAVRLLSTQTKARVNGTQKWFARRIIQHLKRNLANGGAPAITCSIHRVGAEEVHRARNVLAAAEPVYQKIDVQSAASHVVDATLTFACGLQDPQLADTLTWPLDDDLEQQTGWLHNLIPANIAIHSLQSKAKYRKPNPAGQKLFKDSLYGERFVPLLIDKKGKLAIGFEPKNSLAIARGEQQWFELLRPFLRFQNKPLDRDFLAWQQNVRDSGRAYLYFTIDKPAAFEHLYKVAKSPAGEVELQQADLLDGLRYIVQKQDLSKALVTPDGKRFKKRGEVLKDRDFAITVAFSGGRLPRDLDKPKGKLTLPAKSDWDRLLGDVAFKRRFGEETKDFNWRTALENIFPSKPTGRRHRAVRKVYSLPVVAAPSGGFRARRYTPDKQPVWQLMSVEGYAAEGFELEASGQLGEPAMLPLLRESPSLVSDGQRHRASADEVCRFDEWRDIAVDAKQFPWLLRLEYAPGTQDRFYVRVTMPFSEFRKQVLPYTAMAKGVNSPAQLGVGIKVEEPRKYREKLGELLAQPRSHLFVTAIGENVAFWYIVESTSAAMRERYQQAYGNQRNR
jgi:CRISPR system subtype II-B RNA-guided endonuclease Cas9/Csx12